MSTTFLVLNRPQSSPLSALWDVPGPHSTSPNLKVHTTNNHKIYMHAPTLSTLYIKIYIASNADDGDTT